MFTGIIEDLAKVDNFNKGVSGALFVVESAICSEGTAIGDSISVNGTCLTVTKIKSPLISFDVSSETIEKTSLSELTKNSKVNLERALKADSRIGGHFVTGHIDTTGTIESKVKKGEFTELKIAIHKHFLQFLVEKGSVAIDGISLTVNSVEDAYFTSTIIPHTLSKTTLSFKKVRNLVNIETDIFAKYIHKYTSRSKKTNSSSPSISSGFLKEHGFF